MVYNNILEAIGHTPMTKLNRLNKPGNADIFVKFEGLNVGIGDGIIPSILNTKIYDHIHIVTDEDAINTAKQLASLEGIMCGISAGTNVAAALKLAEKLGPGKTVVTILPDTAERYFSTPLFDE